MNLRRFLSCALTALLAVAGGAMLFSADVDDDLVYRISLAVATLSGTALMVLRTRLSAAALERVRQEGYFAGFTAAKGRPTVVSLGSARSAGLVSAGSSQQFLEQHNVTDSA